MKQLLTICSAVMLFAACKKSTSSGSSVQAGGGGNISHVGGATEDHKASGAGCKDTVWLPPDTYAFAGNTFYVDSGYVATGEGIVAAIDGAPQIKFNNSYYSIIKDSTAYFPTYLSASNSYSYDGNGMMSFNSYTTYSVVGYRLCSKTEVYSMTEYGSYGNNRLVLYRNL
jgi:hypothetical protein